MSSGRFKRLLLRSGEVKKFFGGALTCLVLTHESSVLLYLYINAPIGIIIGGTLLNSAVQIVSCLDALCGTIENAPTIL